MDSKYIFAVILSICLAFTNMAWADEKAPTLVENSNTQVDVSIPPSYCPPRDRFEAFNRVMFRINDAIDRLIMKPIACLYNKIIPHPLNQGIHNFYMNLNTIPTIANDLLQLHFYQMSNDAWRLAINSTVGIGGFFDVASRIGLEPYSNDFGLTLARYGWENSTYLVLPLYGPNTIRDVIEIPVDYYYFSIYPWIRDRDLRYFILGVGIIDRRAQLLKLQCVFEEAALDKYIFIRDAYLQRRNYQIETNKHRSFAELNADRCVALGIRGRRYLPVTNRPAVTEPGYYRIGI